MNTMLQIGSKVRLLYDTGGEPGTIMSYAGNRLRIYWPDLNVFTCETPSALILYGIDTASQPHDVAAV
jgi:hypothetical protein